MPVDSAPIVVVAGVIERDGRFLVTRRLKDTHLSGFWEFPGGKCEADESHEACLARELREELGAASDIGPELMVVDHVYPTRAVRLHFRVCRLIDDPVPQLGQEMRWIARDEMKRLDFPEADRELVELLTRTPDSAT